jgi:hypothetical protein
VPAAPAGAWAAVCGGVQFGCGLDAAGRAWCWGTDTSGFGFLGQGATATQTLQFPSPVVGGHLFASITCGYIYVCALTPSGAAYCWGARRTRGRAAPRHPLSAPTPPAVQDSTAAATSGWATRSTSARPRPCRPPASRRGPRSPPAASTPARSPPPQGRHRARSGAGVSARSRSASSVSLRVPSSRPAPARAGDNSSGQVGVAASPSVPTPLQVAGLVAADVSAGGDFSCAVVGAGVKCWCALTAAARPRPRRRSCPCPRPRPSRLPAGGATTMGSSARSLLPPPRPNPCSSPAATPRSPAPRASAPGTTLHARGPPAGPRSGAGAGTTSASWATGAPPRAARARWKSPTPAASRGRRWRRMPPPHAA